MAETTLCGLPDGGGPPRPQTEKEKMRDTPTRRSARPSEPTIVLQMLSELATDALHDLGHSLSIVTSCLERAAQAIEGGRPDVGLIQLRLAQQATDEATVLTQLVLETVHDTPRRPSSRTSSAACDTWSPGVPRRSRRSTGPLA
jgi:hypothetical protein